MLNSPTERKTVKCYFWSEPSLLKFIDEEADKKMMSRSAYLRWLIINYNEETIRQVKEIYNEIVVRKRLDEFTKQK
jgi:predicted Rossmann-fold nucleotide-binding protein